MCILIPIFFSFFIGNFLEHSRDNTKISIAILNEDPNRQTQSIIEEIKRNPLLTYVSVANKSNGLQLLKNNKVSALYVFKKDMIENINKENLDEIIDIYYLEKSLVAPALKDLVAGDLMPYIAAAKSRNTIHRIEKKFSINIPENEDGLDITKRISNENGLYYPINFETLMPAQSSRPMPQIELNLLAKQISIGITLILTILFLLYNSISIIKEKQQNITLRLKASGVTTLQLAVANLLSIFLCGIVFILLQWSILFVFFRSFFQINILGFIIIYSSYLFCIASILCLSGYIFNNISLFQSTAPIVTLILGLLGGCFWSTKWFPNSMQTLSHLTPTYQAMDALNQVMIYGLPVSSILINIITLFVMGLFFTIVTLLLISYKFMRLSR